MRIVFYTFILFCTGIFAASTLSTGQESSSTVQSVIDSSTFTMVQEPLIVRSDRATLDYFIENVEKLSKYGKDFQKKELILENKGNGRYGIQMPRKNITGEFELKERQLQKVVYMGQGDASMFFHFSGNIVLAVDYATKSDELGNYEEVNSTVYMKFDNAFFAFLAKAASPLLKPKLNKLIMKLSMKTKKVVESAYRKNKRKNRK